VKQLRSVDATFLHRAASGAAMQSAGLSAFEPRRNFSAFLSGRDQRDLTSCIHIRLAPVMNLKGRDRRAALPRSEAMRSHK